MRTIYDIITDRHQDPIWFLNISTANERISQNLRIWESTLKKAHKPCPRSSQYENSLQQTKENPSLAN